MTLQIREDESRLTDSDMARIIERIFVALEYGFLDWDAVLPPATGVSSVSGTAPIVSSGGSTPAISLANAGVSLAKMADLATARVIGRTTAGTGVPEAVTIGTASGQVAAGDHSHAADATTWIPSGSWTKNGTVPPDSLGNNTTPSVSFADGQDLRAIAQCVVPTGKTAISSLKVYYENISVNLNIILQAGVKVYKPGFVHNDNIDETLTSNTYTSSANNNYIESFTLNADVFNGLAAFAAGSILTVRLERIGSSPSDTYGAAWFVLGLLVTWA